MSTLSSKERNILDLAKNLQDDLHVYCKGAAGSGDNFYARTFANLADRADELVKLLESAPETCEWREKAAAWLREKAAEQEKANREYPDHAAAYQSWRDRPGLFRMLADSVLREPNTQKAGDQHGG